MMTEKTNIEVDSSEKQPPIKKPKKGSVIYEAPTSVRKLNALREGNINFASHISLILSLIIAFNVGFVVYTITKPTKYGSIYVQSLNSSGYVDKVPFIHKNALGPVAKVESIDVDSIVGALPITSELGLIMPRPKEAASEEAISGIGQVAIEP